MKQSFQNKNQTTESVLAAKSSSQLLRNQRGQGLVEYLVIVALMGVATIAIVRTMGAVVSSRFASVSAALQGEKSVNKVKIEASDSKKRDLGDFMNGVESKSQGSGSSSNSNFGGQ